MAQTRSKLNQRAVLRLIASGQATSQRQIADVLRVPPNTIHGIVSDLVRRRLICFDRAERRGRGRPSEHYRIRRRQPVLVAQCHGSVWNAAVFADQKMLGGMNVAHCSPLNDFPEAARELRRVRDRTLRAAGLAPGKIAGIVLAINAVEGERGNILTSSVLPWVRNATSEQFGRALGCRVELRLAVGTVIPELRARAARGVRSLVVLNVGDGVSAHGQSVDKVWGVHQAMPGEVGHIVADPDGPRCGCGNRGCLEAMISGPAMVRRVRADLKRGVTTKLTAPPRRPPSEMFAQLEGLDAEGDRYARAVTHAFLDRVAWAVSIVANMMAPGVIVLSGYALQGREAWKERILARARECTLFGMTAPMRLEFPLLGPEDYLRELAASFEEANHG